MPPTQPTPTVAPPRAPRPEPVRTAPRPEPARRGPLGRAPEDLGHRTRAAAALLGVSVVVGVVLAGMVTIALFLAGVALERALG